MRRHGTHILDRGHGGLSPDHALELPSLGAREQLDAGTLALYVVDGAVDERRGRRFTLDTSTGRLEAAIDGDPAVLTTPIEFRIEPRALRLLVPPRR